MQCAAEPNTVIWTGGEDERAVAQRSIAIVDAGGRLGGRIAALLLVVLCRLLLLRRLPVPVHVPVLRLALALCDWNVRGQPRPSLLERVYAMHSTMHR